VPTDHREAGPRDREAGVLRDRDREARKPPGEQDEAQREELAAAGERERRRDHDVDQSIRRRGIPFLGVQELLALPGKDRQNDEQVAGGEGGHQRIARVPDHVAIPERRQDRHQPRDRPQRQHQGDHRVDDDQTPIHQSGTEVQEENDQDEGNQNSADPAEIRMYGVEPAAREVQQLTELGEKNDTEGARGERGGDQHPKEKEGS